MALPGRHFVSSYLLLHGKPMAMQKEIKSVALKEFGCFIFFFFYLFLTIFSFFISSHFNSSWSSTRSNHLPDRIKYLLHWEINLSQMLMRDSEMPLCGCILLQWEISSSLIIVVITSETGVFCHESHFSLILGSIYLFSPFRKLVKYFNLENSLLSWLHLYEDTKYAQECSQVLSPAATRSPMCNNKLSQHQNNIIFY